MAEICASLLLRMSPDYVEKTVRDKIRKLPKTELEYVLQGKVDGRAQGCQQLRYPAQRVPV